MSKLIEKKHEGVMLVGSGKETKLSKLVEIAQTVLGPVIEIQRSGRASSEIKRQQLNTAEYSEFMNSQQLIPIHQTVHDMKNDYLRRLLS